jgi:shikimate dehydrogenase
VVNSTSLGLNGGEGPFVDWTRTRPGAVAMDMVYRPLDTTFLKAARSAGRRTVDGLEMLIRQAIPSFEYFYGAVPPETVDVRALCLAALG